MMQLVNPPTTSTQVSANEPVEGRSLDYAEAEPKAQPAEKASRSIAKTFSWRIIASIDTLILSFLVMYFVGVEGTGSAMKAASIIAGLEVPNKLLLYYFHERMWARIQFGRRA